MRAVFIPIVLAAPLVLGACASSKAFPTYQQEYDRLSAECTAGGGILTTSGAQTGRPQTDYVCKIIGSPTRIPRN